jgi:transposase-like protein
MEDNAECMLVPIGATPEGKKELVGFQVGVRESAQSWRGLLVEVKRRGLKSAPEIAVGDGALGFWKALDEKPTRRAMGVRRHQRQRDLLRPARDGMLLPDLPRILARDPKGTAVDREGI